MKVKKSLKYILLGILILVPLIIWRDSVADFREAGISCNITALEMTKELNRMKANAYQERYYVTCMRMKGYLLESQSYNEI
jgi:hypothetical protein